VAGASSLFAVRVTIVALTARALVINPLAVGPAEPVQIQDPVVEVIQVRRSKLDFVEPAEAVLMFAVPFSSRQNMYTSIGKTNPSFAPSDAHGLALRVVT
jgi:hypothetical protein